MSGLSIMAEVWGDNRHVRKDIRDLQKQYPPSVINTIVEIAKLMRGKACACWMKQAGIAELAGHARETINRAIALLVQDGWLIKVGRSGNTNARPPSETRPQGMRSVVLVPAYKGKIRGAAAARSLGLVQKWMNVAALKKHAATVTQLMLPALADPEQAGESSPSSGQLSEPQLPPAAGPLAPLWDLPTHSGPSPLQPKPFERAPLAPVTLPREPDPPGTPSASGGLLGQNPPALREGPVDRSAPIREGVAQDRRAAPALPPTAPIEAETASPHRSPGESLTQQRERGQAERMAKMLAEARARKDQQQ